MIIGLPQSRANNYNLCGVYSVASRKKQIYILGFTRRIDRVR